MTTHLKKAKLVIYEGIGHALHWEEPKRFVNDLLQFIQSVQLNGDETNIKK
jgi:pimeloyl-ACP methyl ester carboxylesterase